MLRRAALIHFILSIIGIILGISGTMAFSYLENTHATLWSFMSAIYAAANFHLNLMYLLERLDDWYSVDTLASVKCLAFFTWIISFSALVWYIFTWQYYSIPILPVCSSAVIDAVWAFMTFKWSLLLHISAHCYSRSMDSERISVL